MIFLRAIFYCLILLFTSCEGPESCIEAGDFGNSNKSRIIVYPYESIYLTRPENKDFCYPISGYETLTSDAFKLAIEALPSSTYNRITLLKYCLLGYKDYTKTTVGDQTSKTDSENTDSKLQERNCYTKTDQARTKCFEECADGCKQLMEIPRWTATIPSTETLKGIDIEPNTMISIKVKGQVSLGEVPSVPVSILSDLNSIQPAWSVKSTIQPNLNYNLKIPIEPSGDASTYQEYYKTIMISRKNSIPYANIAPSSCDISYLMKDSTAQTDPQCPVTPNKIGYLNTVSSNNSQDPNAFEKLPANNEIVNSDSSDKYLIFKNKGTGTLTCSIDLEVTEINGNGKYLRINNYEVKKEQDMNNEQFNPFNNRLITLYANSKLTIKTKTNCEEVLFKKFRFNDINIEESGFISIKNITGQSCTLKARIINPNGSKCIKSNLSNCDTEFFYDNSTGTPTEQISHFYEYESNFTSSGVDPLKNLSVTSNFSNENIYVRKGQKIRILPETFQQNITFSNNGTSFTKNCGYGMFFKINPRPPLMCFSSSSTTSMIPNPSCKLDYSLFAPSIQMDVSADGTANSNVIQPTSTDLSNIPCISSIDCASETERQIARSTPSTSKYCVLPNKCAKVSCTYDASGKPSCSGQPPDPTDATECQKYYRIPTVPEPTCCGNINTCSDADAIKCNAQPCCSTMTCSTTKENLTCTVATQQMCDNCRTARINNLNLINKKISVNLSNCYDFSGSNNFSAHRLIAARSSFSENEKTTYNIKDLSPYQTYDGIDYGNLTSYENHPDSNFKKIENLPPITHQEVQFFKINNQDFLNFATATANSKTFELYTPDITTFSNGQNLEVVLCKESSSTSIDCTPMASSGLDHSSTVTVLYSSDYDNALSNKKNWINIYFILLKNEM